MESIELLWNPLISKRKTDGMHHIDFCILSQGHRNWAGGDTVRKECCKYCQVRCLQRIKSDIRSCECCECLDPLLTLSI